MRPIVERVGRMQRLAVFDAAARSGSFTGAAADLAMTQPAVTRQIRALERSLGVELFERTANRSSLSPAGRRLADALDAGFAGVERTLADMSADSTTFVIAAPPGFAQQLIVPALDELHDAVHHARPGCDIRLWLYNRDGDLDHGDYDAAIRIGRDWPGRIESSRLFSERAVPVATPALAAELGLDEESRADEVLAAPLIHMDADDRPWMSWSDWLAHFDLELTSGRRRVLHNTYPTVVQQALAGRGIALGWRGLIEDFVRDGLLVVVGPEVETDRAYCLTWRAGSSDPAIEAVVRSLTASIVRPLAGPDDRPQSKGDG